MGCRGFCRSGFAVGFSRALGRTCEVAPAGCQSVGGRARQEAAARAVRRIRRESSIPAGVKAGTASISAGPHFKCVRPAAPRDRIRAGVAHSPEIFTDKGPPPGYDSLFTLSG